MGVKRALKVLLDMVQFEKVIYVKDDSTFKHVSIRN